MRAYITLLIGLIVFTSAKGHRQITEVKSPTGFIATFPSTVLAGSNASLCIQFINLNVFKSNLEIKIDDDGTNAFDAIQETIPFENRQTCFVLKIKDTLHDFASHYYYWSPPKTIRVSGNTTDGSYSFSDKKNFHLEKKPSIIGFVETDKPVYKPGQKVQIRILALDIELKAKQVVFESIQIVDASKSIVEIWKNITSRTGLLELEFELSNEPNLGRWRIEIDPVSKKTNEKIFPDTVFEVKNYVLPKFEVVVKQINSTNDLYYIEACGMYSFGKPVKGEYILHAFPIPAYYNTIDSIPSYIHNYFKNTLNLTLEFANITLKSSNNGKSCEIFVVNTSNLTNLPTQSTHFFNRDAISYKVNVTVIEHGTGLKANASMTIENNSRSAKSTTRLIKLIEPKYYKPGLPIHIKAKIQNSTQLEGDGLREQKVNIKVLIDSSMIQDSDLKSDEHGVVELFVEIPKTYLSGKEHFEGIHIKVSSNDVNREFIVYPWYSRSGIYMQLYQKSQLNCDTMGKYELIIAYPSTKLFKNHIFFQIQARHRTFDLGFLKLSQDRIVETSENDQFKFTSSQPLWRKKRSIDVSKMHVFKDDFDVFDPVQVKNKCMEELVEGIPDNLTLPAARWYYNKITNSCEEFTYEGSLGNKNNFKTFEDCESTCNRFSYKKLRYQLSFKTISQISPEFTLIGFFLDNKEIIFDNLELNFHSKCLDNKVDLKLSQPSAEVGQKISLSIQSDKNSLCALSGIDKSVTFMGKQNMLNLEQVFGSIETFTTQRGSYNSYPSLNDCSDEERPEDLVNRRQLRYIGYPASSPRYFNPIESFKKSNFIFLSDYRVDQECPKYNCRHPYCFNYLRPRVYYSLNVPEVSNRGSLNSVSFSSFADVPSGPMGRAAMFTPDVVWVESTVKIKPTIREFFPETWLWSLHTLNENGSFIQDIKVPDTITDWHLNSYCLSQEKGLGVSTTQSLRVFQNFFLMLNLPYSVINQEKFPVKVTVFNYMSFCTPVRLYINFDSKQFKIDGDAQKTYCSCPDEPIYLEFNLQAQKFDTETPFNITAKLISTTDEKICDESAGDTKVEFIRFSDSEKRSVHVEPEGIKKEIVKNAFITLKDIGEQNEVLSFDLPKNLVDKSGRVYLKIIGDLMGSALDNLDHLVQQPYGCGEQNMAKLAPMISVLDYLRNTNQLTEELKRRAINFLKTGYQRQLTYSHPNGLYSAFGSSDKEGGGTWLSAFVLRYFVEMKHLDHIQIDMNSIMKTYESLSKTQDEIGAFQQVGTRLFSKALAGTMSDSDNDESQIALTAYVLASLIRAKEVLNKYLPIFEGDHTELAYEYLKSKLDNSTYIESMSTYTLAITFYALVLEENAENTTLLDSIYAVVKSRSIEEDGLTYWKSNNCETECTQTSASAGLEITSYVLLARVIRLTKQKDGAANSQELLSIVKWINSKRNSFGGFYSTQDTVVALEALSKYASLFYARDVNLTAKYSFNKKANSTGSLRIKNHNRLKLNTIKLTNYMQESNELKLQVLGIGSVQAQIVLKYNIKNETKLKSKFEFSVLPLPKTNQTKKRTLSVTARYVGEGEFSDMTIMFIRLPSGYLPVEESLISVKSSIPSFKRFEITPQSNVMNLYFDSLSTTEMSFEIDAAEEFKVENLKPGYMYIYDYYEPIDDAMIQSFEFN